MKILTTMLNDPKIRDKTEQVNFFSTLIAALFNQPKDKYTYYFQLLQVEPITIFDKFVELTNDTEQNILNFKNFVKNIKNVQKIELLPYKTFGSIKYQNLKITERLKGVPEMDEKKCKKLEKLLKD